MKKCFLCLVLLAGMPVHGALDNQPGLFSDRDRVVTMEAEQHFGLAEQAFEQENWNEALRHYSIVAYKCPDSKLAPIAHYHAGKIYFHLHEYDFANVEMDNYLKTSSSPDFFMEAMEYKFSVAEAFRYGARRHLFGRRGLPSWVRDPSLALEIYDEITATLPNHELAMKSLYSKGCILLEMSEYRESVEAFQAVIRRFPKSEFAPEAHLQVFEVYKQQAIYEFQNPDLISLAQIQLDRFRTQFPQDERIPKAEADLIQVKETYAKGLWETGRFYERRKEPSASAIYYRHAVELFPDTHVAAQCRQRLDALGLS